MYLEFYGLRNLPFNNTPDTTLFFEGGNRGAILEALIYAILSGEGIVKVVGEVGSGKTMLCRMAASKLPAEVDLVFLLNPSLSPENIFHAIATELKITLPSQADRLLTLQVLHQHLLERHMAGRQVVVFVEEAQGMPLATLEEVRLLSNLETKTHKLLQIVLFGQPELDEKLSGHAIRQLKERIGHSLVLPPLQPQEIGEYLAYRLWSAGYAGPLPFNKVAVREIARVSRGVLRRINTLAHKSLLAGYVHNTRAIGRHEVHIAIRDADLAPRERRWPVWLAPAFASLCSLAIGLLVSQYAWQTGAVASTPVLLNEEAILASVPLPPAREEVKTPPVRQAETRPAPEPEPMPPVTREPAPEVKVVSEPQLQAEEIRITPPPAEPVKVAEKPAPPLVVASLEPAPLRPALPEVMLDGVSLTERVKTTEQWVLQAAANRFSLQLMILNPQVNHLNNALKKLYRDVADVLNTEDIHLFQLRNDRILIYYGDFASLQEAREAAKSLPEYLRRTNPYPKNLGSLRKELNRIAWLQG